MVNKSLNYFNIILEHISVWHITKEYVKILSGILNLPDSVWQIDMVSLL